MQTVQVVCKIAMDGSGYTLSTDVEPIQAYVLKNPDETYWGKYHLLVSLDTLTNQYPQQTKDSLRNTLQTIERNGIEGVKVVAEKNYIR
jgi:hypothetical protein